MFNSSTFYLKIQQGADFGWVLNVKQQTSKEGSTSNLQYELPLNLT